MYKARLVFFAACIGMLLFGIGLITLGSVAAGLREKFSLSNISAGTLFSILPIGIVTGSLLFGPLCDRYGYKAFLIISSLLMFAGFQGIAFAGSLTLLKVSVYVFGLAGGALNGATNAVVSDISVNNKGANLSLLGVSFAIGALGMPFVLGMLSHKHSFDTILAVVGLLALAAAVFFSLIQFPPAKQASGTPLLKNLGLLKENFILLAAFFLFCQSSFEGIINNWTTTYLVKKLSVDSSTALYALSLYVTGMAVMRLLLGSVFRKTEASRLLYSSFFLLFSGSVLLALSATFWLAVAGLVCIGAGLAGGFPIMLGFVGSRYPDISGTAFSLVLVIALAGNMFVNFLMGVIAEMFGVSHLTTLAIIETAVMLLLSTRILKLINRNNNNKSLK